MNDSHIRRGHERRALPHERRHLVTRLCRHTSQPASRSARRAKHEQFHPDKFSDMTLLRLAERGLYCEAGDFYIDPWQSVERAVITLSLIHISEPTRQAEISYAVF